MLGNKTALSKSFRTTVRRSFSPRNRYRLSVSSALSGRALQGVCDYVLDTIVSITSKMALPIQRNPETFGHIQYCIVDNETEKQLIGVTFDFGFLKVKTNDEGILDALIPIDRQQVSYPVKIDYNGISMHLTYSGDSLQASGHTGLSTIYVQY